MNASRIARYALAALGLLALPMLSVAADPARGKALHDEKCASCHAQRYGGDGSGLYLRSDRLVRDRAALTRRVALCNSMTGAGLRPDEEADIAAYLNQHYYKFGP